MNRFFLSTLLLMLIISFCKAEDLRSDTIDVRSYYLQLDLTDFGGKILKGEARMGIKAKMNGVKGIRLDLLKLTVDSIKVENYLAPFIHNDTLINIDLLTTLNTNDSVTITVFYKGNPLQMSGDIGGFYWTSSYAFNIGVSFLEDPHNYGRVWFPCLDNFRQRSYYEFKITTKNIHKAFCNGILQSETTVGPNKVWHWKLQQPIPTYLASVAVSQYETLYDTVQGLQGVKEIQLAARASDTSNLKNLFVHLPDAFHIYEKLFGPYQWDRIGYCIVPFAAGAMEHATNIGFMQYYLNIASAECEEAMAHELSHHWFGNLVTCDSASEMWLNEGWARYCEKLFIEQLYGDSAYKQSMREMHEDVLHRTHLRDGGYYPVSGVPTEQTYSSTVFDKGADMIHTLRWYMGDSMFFKCINDYLQHYSWHTVSTANLRDYLMQCSGYNLHNYFDDWIYQKGFAHFSIENLNIKYTGADAEWAEFTVRQRLHHAERYYTGVPIKVTYISRQGTPLLSETIWVSGDCTGHQSPIINSWQGIGMIVVDFDENLQDAISDFYYLISDTGLFDFKVARAKLGIKTNAAISPVLVRIEHNWIRPEPLQNKISGLHLSNRRYWTVDASRTIGINNIFNANLLLPYDGTDPGLDQSFFTNTEDSLVVMYRPNNNTEWQIADSFFIDVKNNAADKKGEAIVYNVQKGQYCFAIWNSNITDTTTADADCAFQINALAPLQIGCDFEIFPNPTNHLLNVTFAANEFEKVWITDVVGRVVYQYTIDKNNTIHTLAVNGWSSGLYYITLLSKNRHRKTKPFVIH
ncbi:MAG: T9SS type A sorting domain-containing protein [Chitinophagales bacterium]|nr:T9SS type A sorting domain-containing protein [Chitinophagales bacterium]